MDALLTAILQSAPSWGVGGLLITYIVILIRREGSVADRHTADIERLTRVHEAEVTRLNADHDEELEELKSKIRELRDDLNALDDALSHERGQRLGLTPRRRRDELETRERLSGPSDLRSAD